MRRFSAVPSRASSFTLRLHQSEQASINHSDPNKSNTFLSAPNLTPSSCNPSSLSIHRLKKPILRVLPPIDHHYIGRILGRKDWSLLLNHELKATRVRLDAQSVVSVLQNQDNPIHPLRFYLWVSSLQPQLLKNKSIRAVLADRLYRKGPVVLSAEMVQEIRSCGFQIDEELLCILIGSWGRLGLAKYCVEVFGQISFLGLNPTTRLYNAVIDALVKSNAIDLAYLKFQQMATDNCYPDRFTYNILVYGVCRTGVVDEALRLVKQMEKACHRPNVFTYSILIDGFCNSKRFEEAIGILNTMREKKVNPNDATFRSLVHGVFRHMAPLEAFEMLSKYVQESHCVPKSLSDTVLYCLSTNSMPREAAAFFQKVSKKGYILDTPTFNILMSCWIKCLALDEVCELCDDIIKKGVKPGFNSYLALMQKLFASGRIHDGDRYLLRMSQDGLISNVVMYNMVIDCFFKSQMVDRASEKFMEMVQRGIKPNLVTFNCLISGQCKNGDMSEARKTLEMLLESGYKPDKCTFSSVIDGLCRVHQTEDAFDCLNEMLVWGISPNVLTYNIIIRSLCVEGDIGGAVRLLRKMQRDGISPDVFTFNALIQSFCRMKKIHRAQKLLSSMLTLGLYPDNFTYSAIIKTLCELDRTSEAIEIYQSMEANGCVPDSYTCSLVSNALSHNDHTEVQKHP
uniref:Pentatricopeptide repeat-containing protein n=1 Tax=Kalanchoe fedtschenkoi TaxID=63787 RepID=A0A7N0T768_KALFE